MISATPWLYLLGGCFGLGMLHGVIPDEHTWPITFSYSVGAASGRGGLISGLFFASAFSVQRAIMSQAVYLALVSYLSINESLNGPVYLAVGIAMAIAGYLILYKRLPHWHPLSKISKRDLESHAREIERTRRIPIHWTLIHGFIAGFGVDTGLFTTFIYLVAVPAMPSALLGFAPGAAFGFGTMAVLAIIGLVFGGAFQIAGKWGAERVQVFGTRVGARSLLFGGSIFIISGVLFTSGIANFLPLDLGELLIYVFMILIVVPVMIQTWREVKRMPFSEKTQQAEKLLSRD